LYVTNEPGNTILRFDNALAANGNLTPNATISGSQLSSPQYLFIDTANDRLYVAELGGVLIYEKASTKTGNISADRTIAGASTGLTSPLDLALDRPRDLLYVADVGSIEVFGSASTINGDISSVRSIVPLAGGSGFVIGAIFLDAANDRLYVADLAGSAINIYDGASGLSGSVNANRSLSGTNTKLDHPEGVQVDAVGRLVVANNNSGTITIYANAATVNGNVAPSSAITSNTTSGLFLSGPSQIVTTTGNELYVADGIVGGVPIFAGINAANGNLTPSRNIAGSNTTLSRSSGGAATARGIALDSTR
jgi:6-phosphogluconolactonase (cycloisomerase 2 family)